MSELPFTYDDARHEYRVDGRTGRATAVAENIAVIDHPAQFANGVEVFIAGIAAATDKPA